MTGEEESADPLVGSYHEDEDYITHHCEDPDTITAPPPSAIRRQQQGHSGNSFIYDEDISIYVYYL